MGSSSPIVLETTEAEVVPGQTARYPFTAPAGARPPTAGEFEVVSDNPGFSPQWTRVVQFTDERRANRYVLEVTPAEVRRDQYGRYPLRIHRGAVEARCGLVIKPGVRLTGTPGLTTWPAGKLTLSIENFGQSGVDTEIRLEHQGSNWSQDWESELVAGAGPVTFTQQFEPPAGGRRGTFTLTVSAAGIPLGKAELTGRQWVFPRKAAVLAAVLAAGAALSAGGLALAGRGGAPQHVGRVAATQTWSPGRGSIHQVGTTRSNTRGSGGDRGGGGGGRGGGRGSRGKGSGPAQDQSITFRSAPPANPVPGDTYLVTATGGGSGQPVTFTVDASASSVCSIAGGTVTFNQAGHCAIDANQAASGQFLAAPQAQQSTTVAQLAQAISFTVPGTVTEPSSDTLTATGGASGNPVTFTIDPASAPGACAITAATIDFNQTGACVVDANQEGTNRYAAAPQVTRTVTVQGPP